MFLLFLIFIKLIFYCSFNFWLRTLRNGPRPIFIPCNNLRSSVELSNVWRCRWIYWTLPAISNSRRCVACPSRTHTRSCSSSPSTIDSRSTKCVSCGSRSESSGQTAMKSHASSPPTRSVRCATRHVLHVRKSNQTNFFSTNMSLANRRRMVAATSQSVQCVWRRTVWSLA